MEKFYFLYSFFFVFLLASGDCKDACSQPNSTCTSNEQCCSIANGKSYCNLQIKRCEALRFCDEFSSKKCPFNDLSATEIENVINIIKKSKVFSTKLQFPIVRKQEPKKKLWNSGDTAARKRIAYAAVYDLDSNSLSEVLVSLNSQRIISVESRKDSVPPVTNYESVVAKAILDNDPRINRAYERRGLNATYAALHFGTLADGNIIGRRRVKLIAYYQDNETEQSEWCPVEGLSATIDIADLKIIDFVDKGSVPVPKAPHISVSNRPLTSSEGKSLSQSKIDINGNIMKWHNWRFQYSMDPVYGLQLYHIRYIADCEERFLIYKLSISEMFVPYGADGETWTWRGAFDAGEYGLGKTATPLVLGKDVPRYAKLLPCLKLNDITGEVNQLENCIAVFERDDSPLYKHFNFQNHNVKSDEGMLGTEMVVRFVATVGNYDYMFDLIFSMDGNIEISVFASGLLQMKGVFEKKNNPTCIEDCQDYINEHTVAPVHQHFFSYRIDFDIDGANNMLTEVDLVNDPKSAENPDGGAFSLRRTLIQKETFRDFSAPNARFWSVINPQSRNRFNTPRGYSLHVSNIAFPFLQPGNRLNQALFITHPIWITAYNDDEQGAAGSFPRSGKSGQGLPEYVKNAESLDNADLVVWHTFAANHAPRPEEFPIMNKMHLGFHILSRNFQSANPNIMHCNDQ